MAINVLKEAPNKVALALAGMGAHTVELIIVEHRAEIERLRAALVRIRDYPSLVPSEEHYKQYPDTERFPDFRVIARDALKR